MPTTASYPSFVDQWSLHWRQFAVATEEVTNLWQQTSKMWSAPLSTVAWLSEHAADLRRIWDLALQTTEEVLEASARWAGVVNAMSESLSRQPVVNPMTHKGFVVVDGYVS